MSIRELANIAWYHWRRNNWLFDPRRIFRSYDGTEIERPIFFLGNQGGGLTLIVRMIRRHPEVVTIRGAHLHWSGPDEMQRVMELRLPKSLKLARLPYRVEVEHDVLTAPRSWSYATDALFEQYRKTEADYDESDAETFRFLIREALHTYGNSGRGRFLDKSQVYTLKARLIQAILRESNPHFVLVTRNPYAACYRAATGKAIDMQRYAKTMSLEERVGLCAEHWANAMHCIWEDRAHLKRFYWLRFEDVFMNPEGEIARLCDFLGLDFRNELLPHPDDAIPFGTRFHSRWYPLNPDVNQPYLDAVTPPLRRIIEERCGVMAEQLGYEWAGE